MLNIIKESMVETNGVVACENIDGIVGSIIHSARGLDILGLITGK